MLNESSKKRKEKKIEMEAKEMKKRKRKQEVKEWRREDQTVYSKRKAQREQPVGLD